MGMDSISEEINNMFSELEGGLSDEDLEGLTIENIQAKIDKYTELIERLQNAHSTEEKETTLDSDAEAG